MLLWHCGQEAAVRQYLVQHDLVETFFLANFEYEIPVIDFGTVSARRHMLSGWSTGHKDGDGPTFVFSEGQSSIVDFFLTHPRDVGMTFRCRPIPVQTSPQIVYILLNGKPISRQTLRAGWRKYRILLPGETLSRGNNRLELLYGHTKTTGQKSRAVAWDYIRFDGLMTPHQTDPDLSSETAEIIIPLGTRLDYYLELNKDAFLTFDALTLPKKTQSKLTVSIQSDGREEETIETFSTSRDFHFVPLGAGGRRVARLSFYAMPLGEDSEGATGARIQGAGIRVKPNSVEEAESNPSTATDLERAEMPNVILYLIDALRSDHLGCYGYATPVSPNIDRFAKEGVVFKQAIAQSSWTKASVATIFTGLSPLAHGVSGFFHSLPDDAITLAERLQAAGYRTASFCSNYWVTEAFGLSQGFQHIFFQNMLPSQALHEKFFSWLESQPGNEPFFAYIHTVDPHEPYQPSQTYREKFAPHVTNAEMGSADWMKRLHKGEIPIAQPLVENLVALYDGEIAFNDAQFGGLVGELKERGLFHNSMIILTSDHGEGFYEHGLFGHGNSLYSELLHVPLIIKFPFDDIRQPDEVTAPVQLLDILPTILDCLNLEAPLDVEGRSLIEVSSKAESSEWQREICSHLDLDGRLSTSISEGQWKLIRWWNDFHLELYNSSDERLETTNMVGEYPIMAKYLLSRIKLQESRGPRFPQSQRTITEEARSQLKALGYVH